MAAFGGGAVAVSRQGFKLMIQLVKARIGQLLARDDADNGLAAKNRDVPQAQAAVQIEHLGKEESGMHVPDEVSQGRQSQDQPDQMIPSAYWGGSQTCRGCLEIQPLLQAAQNAQGVNVVVLWTTECRQ